MRHVIALITAGVVLGISSAVCGYLGTDKGIGTGFSPGEQKIVPWILFTITYAGVSKALGEATQKSQKPKEVTARDSARRAKDKLYRAVRRGNLQEARAIIGQPDVVISCADPEGCLVLADAAARGRTEMAKLLLNTTMWEGPQLAPALTNAASHGHGEIVSLLISAGAPVDGVGVSPGAPLIEACRKKHIEVVKLLVQAGANVNARGVGFWPWRLYTPVAIAQRKGYQKILDVLNTSRNAPSKDFGVALPLFEQEKGAS